MIECDVLVIGAGPAGSSAARSAISKGKKTIFIDKKERIGYPVQCAEGIGKYLFPLLPLKIPKDQLKWKIDGMYFWIDGVTIEHVGGFWEGYTIDREKFENWLAKRAKDKGAKLWENTKLIGFDFDNNGDIKKAIVQKAGKEFEIKMRIVIGADGSESTVLQQLGLFNPGKGDIGEIYSWEMKSLNITKPRFEQIFIGDFTPGGYAYIFPKSKNTANIGVGGLLPQKKIEKYFYEFLEIPPVKKQVKNAEFVIEKSKKSIWSDLVDKWIYKNVILAGDAANQNLKPFVEGILPAIICGDIAGKISIKYSNFDSKISKIYTNQIENIFKDSYFNSKIYTELIKKLFLSNAPAQNLLFGGLLIGAFEPNDIEKLCDFEYNRVLSLLKSKIQS
ncbi:MAG: NAD(P)/FAD-dependent oxidoreductase [Candidatus Thermoplasmatota archaeon]